MAIIGDDACWIASTAMHAQKRMTRQVSGIARQFSSNMSRWVHPDETPVDTKVGSVPDEPRQWCAFECADLMEQGLAAGVACGCLDIPEEEVRLCVERSPDRNEYLLTTDDGSRCLLARLNDNGNGFNIYVTSAGEPPRALGPAFLLTCSSAQDPPRRSELPHVASLHRGTSRWTLYSQICNQCQRRGRRLCGKRELAFISHYTEKVGEGEICCMDMQIPEVTENGNAEVWCPACTSEGFQPQSIKLTTRRPTWNKRRLTFSLDFSGRCSIASSKNFQLQVVDKPEKTRLLFGKVGDHRFVLDFHRPLSMIQAFAAAVSVSTWK